MTNKLNNEPRLTLQQPSNYLLLEAVVTVYKNAPIESADTEARVRAMLFSLDDVISEVLADKARVNSVARGQTVENKETIYRESWGALNAWIETKIAKKKGAEVPMLGSFTWELKHQGDGRVMSRPIFLMSDSFVKDHGVKRQRIHKSPDIVKAEEINYSKLAIKYSKSLSKDMVFSGTRDIIKKIGDFVDRSYEFEVEFSFGILKSKEKKVKFEFNQSRLAAILPENMRIGVLSNNDQPADVDAMSESGVSEISSNQIDAERYEKMMKDSAPVPTIKPFAVPKLTIQNTGKPGESSLPSINDRTADLGASTGVSFDKTIMQGQDEELPMQSPTTQTDIYEGEGVEAEDKFRDTMGRNIPEQDRPLSPRVVELMAAMDQSLNAPKTDKFQQRKRAQERVEMQAYMRSLDGIEGSAKEEERILKQSEQLLNEWEDKTRTKVEAFHNSKKTINGWLHEQMATNKAKTDAEKATKLKFQPSFFLPDDAGNVLMPSGSVPGGPHKAEIKDGLKKDLKYQIDYNARKAAVEKAKQLEEEKDYLDHVAMEIDLEAIQSRADHLSKQSSMLESWERDAHIRNLQKLKSTGVNAVKDYIYVNLPDANTTKEALRTGGFTSIGYDTRTGKLPN